MPMAESISAARLERTPVVGVARAAFCASSIVALSRTIMSRFCDPFDGPAACGDVSVTDARLQQAVISAYDRTHLLEPRTAQKEAQNAEDQSITHSRQNSPHAHSLDAVLSTLRAYKDSRKSTKTQSAAGLSYIVTAIRIMGGARPGRDGPPWNQHCSGIHSNSDSGGACAVPLALEYAP